MDFFCFFELNFGHMAKVGVRHLGRDRKHVFFLFFLDESRDLQTNLSEGKVADAARPVEDERLDVRRKPREVQELREEEMRELMPRLPPVHKDERLGGEGRLGGGRLQVLEAGEHPRRVPMRFGGYQE